MRVLISTLLLLVFSSSLFATQDKKTIKIRLQAPGGNLDETTVYFDLGINGNYVYQEDAQKVFSSVPGVPILYSVTADNIPCSINGYSPLSSTDVVNLGFDVDADGLYTISAPQINSFDPTSILRLEDRARGTWTDLRSGPYTTQLLDAEPALGRFYLHVSYPSSFNSTNAGCANNDGTVTVNVDNSITWTSCTLFDAFNNQVGTFSNVNGPVTFTGLAEGDYYTALAYDNYTTTNNFHISGNYVVANIGASAQMVYVGQQIDFSALATNSNQYEWDFGDGTLIVGVANPHLSYYEPGTYDVVLTASNSLGCTDIASVTIVVDKVSGVDDNQLEGVKVTAYGKEVTVNMNDDLTSGSTLNVYNLLGQSVYNQPLDAKTVKVAFDEQPMGYYLVSVKNNNKVTTKRVYIGQ